MDFATKTIEYHENSLKLQIWDSAGSERYKALIPSYVRGASIIFIVYDVSIKETFLNLPTWINFIKQINTDNSLLILVGNKIDLKRSVSTKEGQALAQKEKMLFFETSAKSGANVNRLMYSCIAELPFFAQFAIADKQKLIEELERINCKRQNINVVEADKNSKQPPVGTMNVNGREVKPQRTALVIEEHKKGCAC